MDIHFSYRLWQRLSLAGLSVVVLMVSEFSSASSELINASSDARVEHPHEEHPHLKVDKDLSVADIFAAAFARAPENAMTASYASQAESQQRVSRNWLADRPRFNVNYWDDQFVNDTGLLEMEAGIEMDLWRRGQRQNAKQLALQYEKGKNAWDDYFRLIVTGRVRETLHQIAMSSLEANHAGKRLGDVEQLLVISEKRYSAGEIAYAEHIQAENLKIEVAQKLLESQAEMVDAERQYTMLTGLYARPENLTESIPSTSDISTEHPQLRFLMARQQQQFSKLEQQRQQAAGNTTVALRIRREQGSRLEPEIESLGLSVTIPFGSSSVASAAVAEGSESLANLDMQLQHARLSLQRQLHEVQHDLDVLENAIRLATTGVELSRQRWNMAERAFELGESDIRPTILALQEYRDSELHLQQLQLRRSARISSFKQIVGELL
ncbi:TolC family protein [Spongiibacter sp. KMU-158]|uniref:TolC family protein n=1 Tax=Spongiibacter pelagi TaxID=2760804 RepID=A0A927C258_9GAMM|nr:TolC family protein [Spongiibacter pelagi]MBD2858652.1 TolC family protein [Spongiibacter pelagi]